MRDHRMGTGILIPRTGFVCFAIEGIYQTHYALDDDVKACSTNEVAYRFCNNSCQRVIALGDDKPASIVVTLARVHGSGDWYEFRIQSTTAEALYTIATD